MSWGFSGEKEKADTVPVAQVMHKRVRDIKLWCGSLVGKLWICAPVIPVQIPVLS